MSWDFQTYSVILFATTAISWALALLAWNRRGIPGNRTLASLMAFAGIWALLAGLEAAVIETDFKIFISKLEYLGFTPLPAMLLLLVLEVTQKERSLTNELRLILWAIPLLTVGLVLTNEFHHLVWTSFDPGPAGSNLLIYRRGVAFWLFVIYTNVILSVVAFLLVVALLKQQRAFRRNLWIMLVGSFFPWAGSMLYVTNSPFLPGYDTTPLAFFLTGLAYSFGVLRFRMLDLVPIARDAVIENLPDGAMIFDGQSRLVDINPAGQALLGLDSFQPGDAAENALRRYPGLLSLLKSGENQRLEIAYLEDNQRILEATVSAIHDRGGRTIARAMLLHDISGLKAAEAELTRANEQLLANLEENRILQSLLQEQAIRDTLTGLYNRRYLDETLEREISRAERESYPICLLMLDIDNLKDLNDNFGHKFGDQVLQALGQMLLTHTRRSDIPCRIGGDEFIIVLPRMPLETGLRRAEEMREYFNTMVFHHEGQDLHASFSAGAAVFPQNGKTSPELLRAVDSAMYQAKSGGRNQVFTVVK